MTEKAGLIIIGLAPIGKPYSMFACIYY